METVARTVSLESMPPPSPRPPSGSEQPSTEVSGAVPVLVEYPRAGVLACEYSTLGELVNAQQVNVAQCRAPVLVRV
eukprot:538683-Rhodomonas_salina.2